MNKVQKPLYKTLLKLRCTPQSRDKIFNFKKQKWANLVKGWKRANKIPRFLYDQPLFYKLPKSTVVRSKMNYRNILLARQKFKLLLGQLSNKALKNSEQLRTSIIKNSNCVRYSTFRTLLKVLNYRIDKVLFDVGFVRSLREARQLIRCSAIQVNNVEVNFPSYILKFGDCITIDRSKHRRIKLNLILSNLKKPPVTYVHTNYKMFEIVIGPLNFSVLNQYSYFVGAGSTLKLQA